MVRNRDHSGCNLQKYRYKLQKYRTRLAGGSGNPAEDWGTLDRLRTGLDTTSTLNFSKITELIRHIKQLRSISGKPEAGTGDPHHFALRHQHRFMILDFLLRLLQMELHRKEGSRVPVILEIADEMERQFNVIQQFRRDHIGEDSADTLRAELESGLHTELLAQVRQEFQKKHNPERLFRRSEQLQDVLFEEVFMQKCPKSGKTEEECRAILDGLRSEQLAARQSRTDSS